MTLVCIRNDAYFFRTLGRGQLNLGELDLAVTTLSKVTTEMKGTQEAIEAADDLEYARELCGKRDVLRAAAPLDEQALFSRAVGGSCGSGCGSGGCGSGGGGGGGGGGVIGTAGQTNAEVQVKNPP